MYKTAATADPVWPVATCMVRTVGSALEHLGLI